MIQINLIIEYLDILKLLRDFLDLITLSVFDHLKFCLKWWYLKYFVLFYGFNLYPKKVNRKKKEMFSFCFYKIIYVVMGRNL